MSGPARSQAHLVINSSPFNTVPGSIACMFRPFPRQEGTAVGEDGQPPLPGVRLIYGAARRKSICLKVLADIGGATRLHAAPALRNAAGPKKRKTKPLESCESDTVTVSRGPRGRGPRPSVTAHGSRDTHTRSRRGRGAGVFGCNISNKVYVL